MSNRVNERETQGKRGEEQRDPSQIVFTAVWGKCRSCELFAAQPSLFHQPPERGPEQDGKLRLTRSLARQLIYSVKSY